MASKQTTSKDQSELSKAAECVTNAANCAGEAMTHATSALGEVANQKVDDLAAQAGAQLQGLGDSIRQQSPKSGLLGSATKTLGQSVRSSGDYLAEQKFSGLMEDVATIVKQHPLPAVLVAFTAGWWLARRI